VKNHTAFLRLILTRWEWASQQPKVCLLGMMKPHRAFADPFAADLIRAIFAAGGNWQMACDVLSRYSREHEEKIKRFAKWARRITSPARRGLLLEWKGGAK
jgi:hypothetical protein